MPIARVNTNSNYHLLILWGNQKASYYLHLKSLFLGQRGLKNREKFQKKKKPRKRERKRKLDGQRERERERERERGEEEEEEEEEDEDEDEVTAAKSVHDPDSRIFLQLHTFFFFFQI